MLQLLELRIIHHNSSAGGRSAILPAGADGSDIHATTGLILHYGAIAAHALIRVELWFMWRKIGFKKEVGPIRSVALGVRVVLCVDKDWRAQSTAYFLPIFGHVIENHILD